MTRFKRLVMILCVSAVITPLLPAATAGAVVTCQRYGWAKATVLSDNIGFPDITWAEVREQGWWRTSGASTCWGKGLYSQTQVTNSSYSYCYWNSLAGAGNIDNTGCFYYLTKTYWYNDGTRNRYTDMTFRTRGDFSWVDVSCVSPCSPGFGSFKLNARFTIRYDGNFSRRCWFDGSIHPDSYMNCASGTGSGTGT